MKLTNNLKDDLSQAPSWFRENIEKPHKNKILKDIINRTMQFEGYNLLGPISADTMFYEKKRRKFDAAICMYHDQALIPIKTLDFHTSVNLTIGLSFIRTSPDHGTAFDIVGKNKANVSPMLESLKLLLKLLS